MRILITGSEGLIGKILWQVFYKEYDVFGLDANKKEAENYFTCDISKKEEVEEVLKKIGSLDSIIHLGADSNHEASWESVLQNNIIGTRNIYEAARGAGIKKIIFASSNRVTEGYEKEIGNKIIKSSDPAFPVNYYGVSKLFGEGIAKMYLEKYGIESICFRIGSLRPDDDPTTDPRFLKTWLSHRDMVQLFKKALTAKIPFGIYYGVSANKGRFWDIDNACKELGYEPQDDASLK